MTRRHELETKSLSTSPIPNASLVISINGIVVDLLQFQAMGQSNYALPVSVPVNSYGESLLGSSPQMAHTSISPRPSSSETDSGILQAESDFYIFTDLQRTGLVFWKTDSSLEK